MTPAPSPPALVRTPLAMLARAVMCGNNAKFWNAMPMPRRSGAAPTIEFPADEDIPFVRLEHARDHAEQDGLAAARRSEYRNDFSGLDGQRKVVGRPCRAERLANRFEFEPRHRLSLSPRPATSPSTR